MLRMAPERETKEIPSSDAETDRMEGVDERESQLEQLASTKTASTAEFSSAMTGNPATAPSSTSSDHQVFDGTVHDNDKKRSLETADGAVRDDERPGETQKKIKLEENGGTAQESAAATEEPEQPAEKEKKTKEEKENGNGDARTAESNKLDDEEEDLGEDEEEEEEDEEEEEEEEEEEKLKKAQAEEEEEEQKENNRVAAMNRLKDIEILFAQLKDKLYETQLRKLEFELKLCQTNKHPELLDYMKMVDDDFQKKAERLMNLQKYKLKCLDNQTRAYRVVLHQQFMKNRQDLKSQEVVKITTDWYDINKERRTMDMQTLELPEYYQYNESVNSSNIESYLPTLVHQRNSVYKELSVLQGLVDYKQMIPSSLNNLRGCSEEEINTDLQEMGLI